LHKEAQDFERVHIESRAHIHMETADPSAHTNKSRAEVTLRPHWYPETLKGMKVTTRDQGTPRK
jgi:hypothetical protein